MNEMKYKQGDILKDSKGYRKILGVCGEIYYVSMYSRTLEGDELRRYSTGYTQYQLDNLLHCELYAPPEVVEMTVAEISEALGKTVKVVE